MTLAIAITIAVAAENLVTFLAFGWDKWMARRGSWRTPEKTLLGLMFATGIAGGWWGMSFFRHKTQKRSFRIRAVLVTVLNPAWILLWLWIRSW